jgi:hypothetical protein
MQKKPNANRIARLSAFLLSSLALANLFAGMK